MFDLTGKYTSYLFFYTSTQILKSDVGKQVLYNTVSWVLWFASSPWASHDAERWVWDDSEQPSNSRDIAVLHRNNGSLSSLSDAEGWSESPLLQMK